MAVSSTGTVVHFPFVERPGYGGPHPEGLAVGHVDVTGDASGGQANAALQGLGRFLYRLELFNTTKGTAVVNGANYLTAHLWATERSGLGAAAFSLNWVMEQAADALFSTYNPRPVDYQMIRRFPIGQLDKSDLYVMSSINWNVNEDTVLYDADWVFTYWASDALYRPGFLASFYQDPMIPYLAA